jgi:signal transduction histidine kinase
LFLLEERARIAHDLHDGTIQTLYALGLECDALSTRPDFPGEVKEALGGAVTRINELIADIRSYITMLEASTPLAQPELTRDLAFIIRQMVPPTIATVVNIAAAALQELTARESEDLLYIAREALSNAVRHGAPTKIAVDLRQTDDATVLVDGPGQRHGVRTGRDPPRPRISDNEDALRTSRRGTDNDSYSRDGHHSAGRNPAQIRGRR